MSEPNTTVLVAPAKKSKTPLLIVIIVVSLVCLAGGAFALLNRHKVPETKPAEPEVKSVLHLDTFVVNVGGPDQNGYLRVGIDLGSADEAKGGEGKEPSVPTALVRDTILAVLTAAQPEELTTLEGKNKLKETIAQALRTRAPKLNLREVYYTEFLLQR